MANSFFIVSVEDQVVQITNYIVRANDKEQAQELVVKGMYAFESDCEVVDTLSSEIKSVEEVK